MENTFSTLQNFLKETSAQRLTLHCRGLGVTCDALNIESLKEPLGERTSAVMLWGDAGRIVIKTHFSFTAAVSWTANGMMRDEADIDHAMAIDFMREFSNLHAGYLRSFFEDAGLLFGMSLPFILAGADEVIAREVLRPQTQIFTWQLSDGTHKVFCTAEIEFADQMAFERLKKRFENEMQPAAEPAAAAMGDFELL